MSLKKITEAAVRVIRDLPVRPTGPTGRYSAAQLQAFFDKTAINIRGFFNDLIDELGSENGAGDIGFEATTGVNARTVQEAVENVQAQIAGAAMGAIPDGSITGAKMAPGGLLNDVTESVTLTLKQDVSTGTARTNVRFYYSSALGMAYVRGYIEITPDSESIEEEAGSVCFDWSGYLPSGMSRSDLNVFASGTLQDTMPVEIILTGSELYVRWTGDPGTMQIPGHGTLTQINVYLSGWYFCNGE